jgi:hypothetical protein
MNLRQKITYALALLMLAGRAFFRHTHWPVPAALHFLAVLFAYYLVLEFCGLWEFLEKLPKQEPTDPAKKPFVKKEPPAGYTGPFWNKPSATFLQANAQPFTLRQEMMVYAALLTPFAVIVYLLLHR